MRVGIDLTALNEKPSGIDRYLVGMVRSLSGLEKRAEFFLFIDVEDRARFSGMHELPKHFHIWPICIRPRFVRLFFQQIFLPLLLYVLRIDVLHSPTFIMPLWRGRTRHVLTIHDMSSFILPQHHPRQRRGRLYERVVSACIRRAGLVTVPSESVKADILRLVSDVNVENIRAIPCGIDDVFHPRNLTEVAPVLQRLGLAAPYILYVGVIDPRKNVPLLIDSFLELAAEGFPEHLVVVGGESWLPNGLSTNERVHRTGYIAEADLPFVYAGAALFVYPSLMEGFGFPPLEAMASSVPVVASNTSSLRENLAGAATLVSPNHKPELVAAMRMLLTDFEARANAIAEGKKRAQSFRWERFAEETFACYQALM